MILFQSEGNCPCEALRIFRLCEFEFGIMKLRHYCEIRERKNRLD